jgi:UDP-D-galactose:(glucosyl)LPS alpha-1,3-D-galactosyltransferase
VDQVRQVQVDEVLMKRREGAGTMLSTLALRGVQVPIVCAVDDRYVGPLCVLMQSLAIAHGPAAGGVPLIVLHRGLTPAGRERVQFHAARLGLTVQLREVGSPPAPYPVSHWVTDAVYVRLSIPEVVSHSRVVLYLDADAVVLRDLTPLLETPLEGTPVAAVRDEQNPILRLGRALPRFREIGLSGEREYFSSGVMLIDLDECARRGLFEECHRFLREMPDHVRFWDQDALNWAAGDDWRRLARRWNTVPLAGLSRLPGWVHDAEEASPLAQLIASEDDAAVLHFAGQFKPWNSTYPPSRARDVYRSFARQVAEAEDA